MSRSIAVLLSMAVAAASIATPSAAQPTTQLLADSCASCHGTDGNSPGSIDKLNDIKRAKFLEEMTEFKYKQGKGRIMGPIARGLSDAQIKALADHFQAFNR